MAWTEENIQIAIEMSNKGYSASKIGAVVGKTRNAVTGKLHRLSAQGDERLRVRLGGARPSAPGTNGDRGWPDEKKLRLLAMRAPIDGTRKIPWSDVASALGRAISDCKAEFVQLEDDNRMSEIS